MFVLLFLQACSVEWTEKMYGEPKALLVKPSANPVKAVPWENEAYTC